MTISDRITSIEEHIKESYQELEGIGIDTTEVDKNLENIPKLIDGYWETLPKVTGEGTSITLDNTKEGKMKINLKGNTSQETTTGKNLFNTTMEQNAWSFVNGNTYTSDNYIRTKDKISVTAGETYTLSFKGTQPVDDNSGFVFYNNGIFVSSSKGVLTFTVPNNANQVVYNLGISGGISPSAIYDIQLELGNQATEYEPYTNGASPNPDYPQDIHVVSGDNSIDVVGKNYFNKDIGEWQRRYLTATGTWSSNNSLMNVGFTKVEPNTTYTWSWEWGELANGMSWTQGMWQFCDKNKTPYSRNQGGQPGTATGTSTTFTTDENCNFIRVAYYNLKKDNQDVTVDLTNHTYSDYVKNIQIEKGSTTSTFEAYTGASYPINLGDIELCKIGDYQDSIVKDNGKWYVNKQIGKYNNPIWNKGSSSNVNVFYSTSINNYATSNNIPLSNNFIGVTNVHSEQNMKNQFGKIAFRDSQEYIRLYVSSELTETELNNLNTIVYYVLDTPTTTEITDSTLLSQLEALNGAKSYTTQTNINQENNDNASILNASALSE